MFLNEQTKGFRQASPVIGIAVLISLPVALLWFVLFSLNPAPDLRDVAVEFLYFMVTLVVYAMVWSLGIRPLQVGGGLFLLGIYMDALDDVFLAPDYVDIYICQGLQLFGMGLFAWSTYYHYTRLSRQMASLHEDLSQMEFRATHDFLTKLPNRLLFHDRLLQAIAHAHRHHQQLALHYIDLGKLKEINDTHGHAAGDHLLWETAQRLIRAIRSSDTAARLGGDEFAIIQTEVASERDARLMAIKLLAVIDKPIKFRDKRLQTSASIGISLYPAHSENIDDLLGMADSAMYQAKELSSNLRIMIYQSGNHHIPESLQNGHLP